MKNHKPTLALLLFVLTAFAAVAQTRPVDINLSTARRGPIIGPLHYGIFYEEINHAGDGGLYAELVRNGSMEENAANPDHWWTLGDATFSISTQNLLNGAQRHAMHLNLTKAGDGTRNIGFWGINVVRGQTYKASLWVRTANDWAGRLTLRLEDVNGADLGHADIQVNDASEWRKYTVDIRATADCQQGWFAIVGDRPGTVYLDCVSLFPPTFRNRPNGMRRDLAEKLQALHPRFVRFPGGCYIEGGLRYQWRHTVGPVEERLGLYNSHWGYPVSNGMGFHEFLQLAEDLGAEPLFVVNVGMGHGWYEDYRHIEGYIQEALDAIEYCNGDAQTTYWGARRAAAGHPEPFGLRLIEIGNENYNFHANSNSDQSDHYAERYRQFYDAIKARYPDIICIGNVESWGTDYPTWRNANPVEVVDEHYYRSPDWFAGMYHKYDNFSRTSYKVYNGEYAVTQDFGTNGTLKAALGEAIYMAGMERNSDVCIMASYAPIFMNENEHQWRPDMLHYNAYASFGTPSYWAQQMMASCVGHQNLTWTDEGNTIGLDGARLGLGSWGTEVTYSNIRVTQADGTVRYTSNADVQSPATTFGTAHVLDVQTADCTIELDAVKQSGDEGFLITFAYADGANYAWWNLGGWANGQHGVEQSVGGKKTTLTTAEGTIETGRTYHIKIVRQGLNTQLYLDDELVHNVNLSSDQGQRIYLCASLNEAEDTAIVKIINYASDPVPVNIAFADAQVGGTAVGRVLTHTDNYAENSMADPMNVSPKRLSLPCTQPDGQAPYVPYEVPGYSLSVLQIPVTQVSAEAKLQPASLPEAALAYDFETGGMTDRTTQFEGQSKGNASILKLDDGNHAAYTGDGPVGYFDLGQDAAQAMTTLLNAEAYSVSVDMLFGGNGQLDHYCWAWNLNNGTGNYVGLINQANNLNWYFERLKSTKCQVNSNSGLAQGTWHNLTVVCDGQTVALYVDAQLRGSSKAEALPIAVMKATHAWLGRSPFSADAYLLQTFFDDLRVYDVPLSAEQVLTLWQEAQAKGTTCQELAPVVDTEPNADATNLIGNNTEVDITALLLNPDFAQGTTGWEGTLFSAALGTVAEHFYHLFDTYQVLRNMPAGRYRLQWQGFYRQGNIGNAHLRHIQGTEQQAEVYAATVPAGATTRYTDCAAVAMHSIYMDGVPYTFDPYTYPDNVATAQEAFANGHYRQTLEFSVTGTADLRLGLRNFTPTVYDWACVDNFSLYYVGPEGDGIEAIGQAEASAQGASGTDALYDLGGRRIVRGAADQLPKGIYIRNGKKIVKP